MNSKSIEELLEETNKLLAERNELLREQLDFERKAVTSSAVLARLAERQL